MATSNSQSVTTTTTVTTTLPASSNPRTHTSTNTTSTGVNTSPQPPENRPSARNIPISDHARPDEMGHGYGEDVTQHQHHNYAHDSDHWGLPYKQEEYLFYAFAIPSWCFNIAAGVIGSYYSTSNHVFIICAAIFQFLSWAAWWQTAVQMIQRASWVRDEGNLEDRRRYLHLAVRLQRLMLPTAVLSFIVFIVAYVRRNATDDLANWLLFQIVFIFNVVGCVMNAYNNITWESDRLEYEEGRSPYGNTLLAILGIPTEPRKDTAGGHED